MESDSNVDEINFWKTLKNGFTVLAPMEDVTDTVFRQIIMETGRPDVFFTEFTSSEGMRSEYGYEKVAHRLKYQTNEHPIVAQIWGKDPEAYRLGAMKIKELGFNGIDINMGCPVKKVIKQGCCSALIKSPTLAVEIISATKEGAGDLPVSVKTRIGFDSVVTEEWISILLEQRLAALTVHGRITSELSKQPADWDEIAKSVSLRDSISPETLIIGNGDVVSLQQADDYVSRYGVDGVMIGRGVFEDPWIFNRDVDGTEMNFDARIFLLRRHVELFESTWGEQKNFNILKKFFKIYVRDFDGAVEFRSELMECNSSDEVIAAINSKYPS